MIAIRASRIYVSFFFFVVLLTCSAVFITQFVWWLKLTLMLLIVAYAYRIWQKEFASAAPRIIGVQYDEDNGWFVQRANHEIYKMNLQGSSVRSRFFMLLNFKGADGKPYSVPVFKDSVSEEGFKALSRVMFSL